MQHVPVTSIKTILLTIFNNKNRDGFLPEEVSVNNQPKHINIWNHSICDLIFKKVISPAIIDTDEILEDYLTKSASKFVIDKCCAIFGNISWGAFDSLWYPFLLDHVLTIWILHSTHICSSLIHKPGRILNGTRHGGSDLPPEILTYVKDISNLQAMYSLEFWCMSTKDTSNNDHQELWSNLWTFSQYSIFSFFSGYKCFSQAYYSEQGEMLTYVLIYTFHVSSYTFDSACLHTVYSLDIASLFSMQKALGIKLQSFPKTFFLSSLYFLYHEISA